MARARSGAEAKRPPTSLARGGEAVIVLSTAPDGETAERIANALVNERLAACVNLVPGLVSIYHWKGAVSRDPEVLCLAKTRRALLARLAKRLKELHPYEVPELIALPVAAGARTYLQWLLAETRARGRSTRAKRAARTQRASKVRRGSPR